MPFVPSKTSCAKPAPSWVGTSLHHRLMLLCKTIIFCTRSSVLLKVSWPPKGALCRWCLHVVCQAGQGAELAPPSAHQRLACFFRTRCGTCCGTAYRHFGACIVPHLGGHVAKVKCLVVAWRQDSEWTCGQSQNGQNDRNLRFGSRAKINLFLSTSVS